MDKGMRFIFIIMGVCILAGILCVIFAVTQHVIFFFFLLKLSGWIFMIISWTCILSLAAFCFSRIFKKGIGSEDSKTIKGLKK